MNWQATSIHSRAVQWLFPGASGRVLSIHVRAANLVMQGNRLLSLVTRELGAGPGTLVVQGAESLRALGWQPGDPIWSDGHRLVAANGGAVRWAGARHWDPPPAPPLAGHEQLQTGCAALARGLAALGRREGLLPAALVVAGAAPVPIAVTTAAGATPVPTHATTAAAALTTMAIPRLRILLAAVNQPERALSAVRGLAGLGPGLTPSGDDLLAGFVYTLGRAGHPAAPPLAAAVEALPPGATSTVSLHLLRWAAAGVVGEHATALVDGLLSGQGQAAPRWLGPLLSHGATSGTDWAAGALLALTQLQTGRDSDGGKAL